MERISKAKANEIIMDELQKGSTYSHCLAVINRKWTLSESTFKRYWKSCKDEHDMLQKSIKEELGRDSVQKAKERQNEAILTREQRMEIASKIAKGEAWKVSGVLMVPNGNERLKALEYLSKIEGDYAPLKQDHTTNGESLNESKDRFAELLKAARQGAKK